MHVRKAKSVEKTVGSTFQSDNSRGANKMTEEQQSTGGTDASCHCSIWANSFPVSIIFRCIHRWYMVKLIPMEKASLLIVLSAASCVQVLVICRHINRWCMTGINCFKIFMFFVHKGVSY